MNKIMLLDKIQYLAQNHRFVFEELVKRDFVKRYKRTVLGMLWSILSPLLTLGVMAFIFTNLFGRNIPHFVIYMFSGLINFNYFVESTNDGMRALRANARIFSKVNVPKYLFLFSQNVASLINFAIILMIYFGAIWISELHFSWRYVFLIYPVACLIVINLGVGFILSAMYIFFQDIQYLYSVFTRVLMYASAIFYDPSRFPDSVKMVLSFNPVFLCISYFREIVLHDTIPGWGLHLRLAIYAVVLFLLGCFMYKKYNKKFLFYV